MVDKRIIGVRCRRRPVRNLDVAIQIFVQPFTGSSTWYRYPFARRPPQYHLGSTKKVRADGWRLDVVRTGSGAARLHRGGICLGVLGVLAVPEVALAGVTKCSPISLAARIHTADRRAQAGSPHEKTGSRLNGSIAACSSSQTDVAILDTAVRRSAGFTFSRMRLGQLLAISARADCRSAVWGELAVPASRLQSLRVWSPAETSLVWQGAPS